MKKGTTRFESEIEGINIHVVKNSALHEEADALVLPEFNNRINRGGLAAQVFNHQQGRFAIEAFEKFIANHDLDIGRAFITRFGGPFIAGVTPASTKKDRAHPDFIIHTTTALLSGSEFAKVPASALQEYRDKQWDIVQNALTDAVVHLRDVNDSITNPEAKIRVINLPLLGSGSSGSLTFRQSSEAMMQVIQKSADLLKRAGIKQINITVHSPNDKPRTQEMFDSASDVLKTRGYETAISAPGAKPFDFEEHLREMNYSLALFRGQRPLTGKTYQNPSLN